MWASAGGALAAAGEAWCAGWARVGRAAAPYSLRLRAGTLALEPAELQSVHAHTLLRTRHNRKTISLDLNITKSHKC